MVTVENYAGLLTQFAVQLIENIVLNKDSGHEILGELKDGAHDSRKEALDANNGHSRHLRPHWEHEGVLGLILDEVLEQSKFFAFVGVKCLLIEVNRGLVWKFEEIFAHGIEKHENDFLATFGVFRLHLTVVRKHGAGLKKAIQGKLERDDKQQRDCADLPSAVNDGSFHLLYEPVVELSIR